jgi:hypothetical protein
MKSAKRTATGETRLEIALAGLLEDGMAGERAQSSMDLK